MISVREARSGGTCRVPYRSVPLPNDSLIATAERLRRSRFVTSTKNRELSLTGLRAGNHSGSGIAFLVLSPDTLVLQP
jgi:hypothetical protein